MNYNEKLKEVAEEMARVAHKGMKEKDYDIKEWDMVDKEETDEFIEAFLPLAAMLLEKMAEAYNQGWVNSIEEMRERDCDFPMSGLDTPRPDKEPEYYLKSLGLIP